MPIVEGQSHSKSLNQCGFIPETDNQWTGAYYHKYDDEIEETYGSNYYLQIVQAITPTQPNPTQWSATITRDFISGVCTTTEEKSENYDTWLQWIDCFSKVVTSATSWTNDCVVDVAGTSNDRSRTQTRTYSQTATNAELDAIVSQYWAGYVWPTTPSGLAPASYVVAYTTPNGVPSQFWSGLSTVKSRYRYRIPEGSNTYMKYVVEEVFTPVGYDAQDPESPQPTTEEKTITWAGPGVEGDDDSWSTNWETMETSEPGIKEQSLIKYQCYTGGPWVSA